MSLNIQALATCSETLLLWHPSYLMAEVKHQWRKKSLTFMTQGKFVYVRRFTRHGKETDNATDNDIDIVVVKVAIYFDYIDYIGEHYLFLVTLIDHC